jgi:phage tail P2-like protein
MDSLLPSNATAWERALERVSGERWPLDADVIRRAKDPWSCPAHLLPYLAYELSVDLWDEAWPLAKKRSVIARSLGLARIKGTEAGVSEAVEIMGGKVLAVRTPQDKLFLHASRTPEQRAAWLAKMPQLRVYPKRPRHPFSGFYAGAHLAQAYALTSEAFFQATPRVTMWRQGVETDLIVIERRREDPTITEAEEFLRVRQRGPSTGFHCGQALPAFLASSTAKSRVYNIRTRRTLTVPGTDRLALDIARPSLEPIDIRPETVRERRPFFGLFCGGFVGAGVSRYAMTSRARLGVFKRIYLLDPEVPGHAQSGKTYLGYNFTFPVPAYTAELKVSIPHRRPPAAFMPFTYGYLVALDPSAKRNVVEAVLTHKSRRDRILLNTHTRDVIRAGEGVIGGEHLVAGQIVAI